MYICVHIFYILCIYLYTCSHIYIFIYIHIRRKGQALQDPQLPLKTVNSLFTMTDKDIKLTVLWGS